MNDALLREARSALRRGDMARVLHLAAALPQTAEGLAEGNFLKGLVEAEAGRVSAALPLVAKAAELCPTAEYRAQLARLLILARRDAEARHMAMRAEASGPEDALTFDTIGCVHARLGDHADAARMFDRAVALAQDNIDFRYNLGTALSFLGHTDEAELQFEAVIARAPLDGRTHYALSGLRRHDAKRNHIGRLEDAVAQASDPSDRLRIRYALAKEYEECGRADDAFVTLKDANDEHRARIGYRFAQDEHIFDAIERLFGAGMPLTGKGDPVAAPIFVVGMPRTGTTLVDRILSSHPDIASAGELQAMPLAVKQVSGSRTRRVIDVETIQAVLGASADAVARLYLQRALQHVGRDRPRFTDKLPANFLYVGFIAQALPAASIVCLRRDPMDTIWSNYKNLFASTSPYYFYSYDPTDTARYWVRFDRLIGLWQRLFPGRVLELRYEDLVADQQGETRRLLAHCGLSWSDACLHFHENEAAVATPSAAQVRQPISGSAIGRWRAYQKGLSPARAIVEKAGFVVTD